MIPTFYIVTSDKYRDLVPECVDRFDRFYTSNSGYMPLVAVLCYEPPPPLPPTLKIKTEVIQLSGDGRDWTTGLDEFFRPQAPDSVFGLMLEDYFIDKPFTEEGIEWAHHHFTSDLVVKFDLTDDRKKFPWVGGATVDTIKSCTTARYRSSLQAALWRNWFFVELCQPGWSAWQFELEGEKLRVASRPDNHILGCRFDPIMSYKNVVVKGRRLCSTS